MVLNRNQKIWLKVTANYPATSDKTADKLTVVKQGAVSSITGTGELKNLPIMEESNAASYYAIVKFTAYEDTQYTFKGEDANIKGLDIYQKCDLKTPVESSQPVETGEEGSSKLCKISYPMNANDIVYLKISMSGTSEDLSLAVSIETSETTP